MPDKAKDPHVNPEAFFWAMGDYGQLESREAFRLHLHLLQGCPECLRRVLGYYRLSSLAELEAMDDPVSELTARRLRAVGEPLLAWLETLPPEERLARVREDRKLHAEALVVTLLERCRALWAAAPAEAVRWSRLAVEAARRVQAADEGVLVPNQLRALAWAHHGNALRILSDLRQAEAAFQRAERALAKGTLDEVVEAEVLALKASLLRAQRRFGEAGEAAGRAIQIYGECEEWHRQGRAFLIRSKVQLDAGEPQQALADLRRAVALVDTAKEPRLLFVVASVELHLLCELGRFQEVRAKAPAARRLAAEHGAAADRLRVRWCEGRADCGLAAPEAAAAAFREARQGFIDQGNGYDAALVSLDLAMVYAGQGRAGEIKELAAEMLPIFESRDVHPEVMATLFLFARAAWTDGITLQLLHELRRQLLAAGSG